MKTIAQQDTNEGRMPECFSRRFADKRAAAYVAWFLRDSVTSRHKTTAAEVIEDSRQRIKVFREKAKLGMKRCRLDAWKYDSLSRALFVWGQWPADVHAMAMAALGFEAE